MERFVFVAAIVVAVIFGLGAIFGGPHFNGGWHFDIDEADGSPAALLSVAPGQLAPETHAGTSLRLRHIAARVVITPEDRSDFSIEITNPGSAPMPEISNLDGRVVIDGHLRGRISDCTEDGAELRGYGVVTNEQMPLITIRAPRSLHVEIGGAGTAQIAAAENLDLEHSGCGHTTAADVANEASVDLAGSGKVTIGASRTLEADVAGSGHLAAGAVSSSANVDIAGSGSVEIASVTGSLDADGAGSGSLAVRGGAVTTAEIDLAGSGDVEIAAPVQSLNVSIVGSGDVTVRGTVGDLDADIAGSGEVRANAITGAMRQEVYGSGHVQVGE